MKMKNVEKIMEQVQVFASAWSLVGSPFDSGDQLEQAEEEKAELQEMVKTMALEQPAIGIIDPDYARIYTQARIIAWQYGYSCCAQGSFTRDLDLLLVPWTDGATKEIGGIIAYIADVCGLRIQGAPSDKPHGRQAWTLLLPGFGEVRWVDVSAFQAAPMQPSKNEA